MAGQGQLSGCTIAIPINLGQAVEVFLSSSPLRPATAVKLGKPNGLRWGAVCERKEKVKKEVQGGRKEKGFIVSCGGSGMDNVRIASSDNVPVDLPCCRCGKAERPWDRIALRAYCPSCQELLALGETTPLVEPTQKNRCAVCNRLGTVVYGTFPLQSHTPVMIDLCPEHLRGLLGRRLGTHGFAQLRRKLLNLGIGVDDIFLLHSAFYDDQGRALQPADELS
jgi:hypothetical protein